MTRERKCDFDLLKQYLEQYDIRENLEQKEYCKLLITMHKSYFSLITWNAELQTKTSDFKDQYRITSDSIMLYFNETISDVASSFFSWINGANKPSRVMLRVGLENFIRACAGVDNPKLLESQDIRKLFEEIRNISSIRLNSNLSQLFAQLCSDYANLCNDSHTSTSRNMAHVNSLEEFPTFEHTESLETSIVFSRVIKNISSAFCLRFNSFFHEMHHKNKENILISIPKKLKPIINGC